MVIDSGDKTHTLVISETGVVYGTGVNSEGQLGTGSSGSDAFSPVAVDVSGVMAEKVIVSVAASNGHSLAFDSEGVVYGWGGNRCA